MLDGVTIVRKGKIDFISNGCLQAECMLQGSFRRCGGQGDVLAGAIGTFNYWSNLNSTKLPYSFKSYATVLAVLAAYAGCCLTRRTNSIAFKSLGRSMLTTDMLQHIGEAFSSLGFK